MERVLKCVVWTVLAVALGVLAWSVYVLTGEVTRTLAEVRETAAVTRTAVKDQSEALTKTQERALALVDEASRDVRYQTRTAMKRLDSRVGEAIAKSDARIGEAVSTVAEAVAVSGEQLGRMNDSVAAVAEPVRGTMAKVDEVLPLWLDCDHNPNCLFNRYVGTMKGIEQASIAMGKAAPETTQAVKGITQSVDTIAARFAKERPWYKKVLDSIPLAGGLASLF